MEHEAHFFWLDDFVIDMSEENTHRTKAYKHKN